MCFNAQTKIDLKLKDKNVENETKIETEQKDQPEQKNDIQTAEEAATVGMFLKYTRMKQKKSIETVSEALCIRKIYLTAIESDDYKTLHPVPYGIGFVRSYATYLGLNPDRIVQIYKNQALSKNEQKPQPIVTKHTKETIPNIRHIVFCLIGLIVLYGIYLTIHFVTNSKENTPDIKEETSVVEIIPATEDVSLSEEEQSEDEKTPEENENQNPEPSQNEQSQINVVDGNYVEETAQKEDFKKMVLKFKGESWLEVKDNNKVYISGIFQKGFEYTIPSEKGLILSVGKYFNVDMYIDDVLTKVATPQKQTGIELDPILKH